MSKEQTVEVLEASITNVTEGEAMSDSREQQSNRLESPVRVPQSSRMRVIDEVDESLRSVGENSRSFRSPASKERDEINSLEAHAQGMLQTMENAKKALFTSQKAKPKKSPSDNSLADTLTHKSNQVDEDEVNDEIESKTKSKLSESRRRQKTRNASNSKFDVAVESPKTRSKGKIDLRRFRPSGVFSNITESKSQPSKSTMKDGANVKSDKRRRRHRSKEQAAQDAVLEQPPKVEGETNTDTTHEDNDDGIDDEESSLEFKLTDDRDNSDKDQDQECDSSSSTASGSGTQKTEGGLLENEKSDKVISASRYIFISILLVAAISIASVSYALFRNDDIKAFERDFMAQAEELQLYTKHNLDSIFDTLKGLSYSTTSIVKRLTNQTGYPPGFINLPDVESNLGLARKTSNALVIAYMPRVANKDFAAWTNYSMENKGWVADQQPGGPLDVEVEINDFVWEYTDYDWEKRGSQELPIDSIADMDISNAEDTSLRRKLVKGLSLPKERPGDCAGGQSRRRGRRDLANTDDNIFVLYHDDDFDVQVRPEPSSVTKTPDFDEYQTPVWQISPVPIIKENHTQVPIINYNLADRVIFYKAVEYMENSRLPVFLDVCDQSSWFLIDGHMDILQTVVAFPVFGDFTEDAPIVGYYTAIIPWQDFFTNNVGKDSDEMVVVMNNTCGEVFSVSVNGGNATIIGEYDAEDRYSSKPKKSSNFAKEYNSKDFIKYEEEVCLYQMTIYPGLKFEKSKNTVRPIIIFSVIIVIFLLTSMAFLLFDCLVTRRQNKLLDTALRQNAIVNSLFPKNVQKKLMEEADATLEAAERQRTNKRRNLSTFLNDDQRSHERKADPFDSKPIADLFPNTTIMFADISGFTAWSSAREPAAVFTLLETIYRAFDEIAKRRRVFKVEVVGDCYVAVCGLPDPRKDHYAVMCRFAQDCMSAMHVHTKELEVRLGPDTGDLSLRVGLHSGPVVAGVLRGDKSRFQLFGDTMNTASRMESTGISNRIQLSQATADLLILNGKEHWITKRQDKVRAKGKGELTTYFLLSVKKKTSSTNSASTSKIDEVVLVRTPSQTKGVKTVQKRNRVADWVVEMLGKLLKEMKAKRKSSGVRPDSKATIEALENRSIGAGSSVGLNNKTVIDEVSDCLKLPLLSKSQKGNSSKSAIPPPLAKEVIDELQHYVYSVASLYKKNPFHNFEHASHVSMSCIKLLNRIASHDEDHIDCTNHHTYGICSDPLTSFGIVFSALIHDVDHCGVPNSQLVKEHSAVATMYKNKSVAEQNSIDIGWGLLMEPTYANLRRHIYTTVSEYKCFRQIVVNCIMATDIVDKDLIKARNKRWDLAFSNSSDSKNFSGEIDSESTKATVVIEHLIQLSDVSHTMQHWHMYRRWNERLFEESYKAYVEGRAEKNPIDNWYQGELGFYDFYIIPLAKKIKQCAVFGVSSDEYLSYAVANRQEWQERGKEVLDDMVKKVETIYHAGSNRQQRDSGTEVGGGASGLTSEIAKSIVSRHDGSREGSNRPMKELEIVSEGNASSSNSECEKCGDTFHDNQQRSAMNKIGFGIEDSSSVPTFRGEDDETGKKLESVLEEGESIMESEFDSAPKDVEIVVDAISRNESSNSTRSEVYLDKDSKIRSSEKDLEMGINASGK
jgi:class 3 adenylate cyclase